MLGGIGSIRHELMSGTLSTLTQKSLPYLKKKGQSLGTFDVGVGKKSMKTQVQLGLIEILYFHFTQILAQNITQ